MGALGYWLFWLGVDAAGGDGYWVGVGSAWLLPSGRAFRRSGASPASPTTQEAANAYAVTRAASVAGTSASSRETAALHVAGVVVGTYFGVAAEA